MKILILSAATGGGHLKASEALRNYIIANSDDDEVVVIDAFKVISNLLDKTVCDGYKFLALKTPKLLGHLYQKTNEPSFLSNIVVNFSETFSQKLIPTINSEKPDVIISTHPFITEMISYLKSTGITTVPLICLMTDYGSHRAWIADKVDAYVVSTKDMIPEMVAEGVDKNKIYPFGIPVKDVFFDKEDRPALLKSFGLDPNLPTVLIMAGSFGVTNIKKIYRKICQSNSKFQLIVITGKNKHLYTSLSAEVSCSSKVTKLIYYTDKVEEYMHASDLLITKPGGMTVSEALACNIPLAIFDAIPGQEEQNAEFLLTHNKAVKLDNNTNYPAIIESLVEDNKKLVNMRNSYKEYDNSSSPKNILALIKKLTKEN